MRWSRGLALVIAVAPMGCSDDSKPVAPACTVFLSGDTDDFASSTNCATSTLVGDAGSWALSAHASGAVISSIDLSIALGASPTTGTLSSAAITSWSAFASSAGDAGCTYSAGATDVPTGSFTLKLDSFAPDAGVNAAHGTLDIIMVVHAPPGTDCGPHDVENVELRF